MVKGEFMRIGIDIDGVLTDVIRYACDYGSKYFFEKYGKMAKTALTLGSQMCVRSHLISGRRLSLLLPH